MKVIYNDGTVAECPEEEELHVIRHSAAHIMAQAVSDLSAANAPSLSLWNQLSSS